MAETGPAIQRLTGLPRRQCEREPRQTFMFVLSRWRKHICRTYTPDA